MLPMSTPPRVILASASPRRRVMLAAADVAAAVLPADLPEVPVEGEAPAAYALRIAAEKARAVRHSGGAPADSTVVAADTVVVLEGAILGKPATAHEAEAMLRALSGRTHEVLTAFAVQGPFGEPLTGVDRTRVTFRELSTDEIRRYVASGEPMDKAGAYGIQGLAGAFVATVDGRYDTVVGLPVEPVLSALEASGAIPARTPLLRRVGGIRARMAAAAQAVGRSASAVTLVAVGKTQSTHAIAEMVTAGVPDIGENYVQEWRDKAVELEAARIPARWHFIGHLQSNKAKYLAPFVAAVHALDSGSAATALDREARRAGRSLDVCVQVNVGEEAQKSGIPPGELGAFLASISSCSALTIRGLMTVPPDGPLFESRRHFAALRALRDEHATADRPLPWLSMGMSGDFDQAIAEGATHVRIGSALFGPRHAASVAPSTNTTETNG